MAGSLELPYLITWIQKSSCCSMFFLFFGLSLYGHLACGSDRQMAHLLASFYLQSWNNFQDWLT